MQGGLIMRKGGGGGGVFAGDYGILGIHMTSIYVSLAFLQWFMHFYRANISSHIHQVQLMMMIMRTMINLKQL